MGASKVEYSGIIDTHAHYDDEAFDRDREELLLGMQAKGIEKIINSAASWESLEKTMELMDRFDFVYGSLGIHPTECEDLSEDKLEKIYAFSKHPKCVAIGEIGLDYYWDEPDRELQKEWFAAQLELARRAELPVVIHSRDAAENTLSLMREKHAEDIRGVIHCYSYSREMARSFLDMGFYFGIGGVVTFSNGKKMKDVVEYIPMDRILLETDSPYLSPVPFRGKRNDSGNLPLVVEGIAAIKGISAEQVIGITNRNAHRLYHKL